MRYNDTDSGNEVAVLYDDSTVTYNGTVSYQALNSTAANGTVLYTNLTVVAQGRVLVNGTVTEQAVSTNRCVLTRRWNDDSTWAGW